MGLATRSRHPKLSSEISLPFPFPLPPSAVHLLFLLLFFLFPRLPFLSPSYVFCVTFPLGHVSPKYVAKLAQLYLRLRFYQFTNPIAGKSFFFFPPKAPTTSLDMNVLDWLLTEYLSFYKSDSGETRQMTKPHGGWSCRDGSPKETSTVTKTRKRSHRQITDAYYLPIDQRPCNLLSKTWLDTKGVLWIIMPGQKCKQRLSRANGDTWSPWLQDIPVERLTSGWCSDERPGWGRGFGVVGKSCLDGRIRKKKHSLE